MLPWKQLIRYIEKPKQLTHQQWRGIKELVHYGYLRDFKEEAYYEYGYPTAETPNVFPWISWTKDGWVHITAYMPIHIHRNLQYLPNKLVLHDHTPFQFQHRSRLKTFPKEIKVGAIPYTDTHEHQLLFHYLDNIKKISSISVPHSSLSFFSCSTLRHLGETIHCNSLEIIDCPNLRRLSNNTKCASLLIRNVKNLASLGKRVQVKGSIYLYDKVPLSILPQACASAGKKVYLKGNIAEQYMANPHPFVHEKIFVEKD